MAHEDDLEELRRRLEEHERLFEILPVGVGIAEDPECRRIRLNPVFARMLELPDGANASLTAPEGERPSSFAVHKRGVELAPEELPMQVAAATGRSVLDEELEVRFADGRITHELISAVPLLGADGRPRGSVAVVLDVSARHRADRQRDNLLALTAALSGAGSIDEVADVTLTQGLEACRAPRGVLLVPSPEGGSLTLLRARGYAEGVLARFRRLPLDAAFPAVEAFRTGEGVFVPTRAEAHHRWAQMHEAMLEDTQAQAALPMIVQGRCVGVLGLSFVQPQVFHRSDRAFLLALAGYCGQAIERAKLLEHERRAREELARSSAELEQFASIASHDLQEPLRTARSFLELFERRHGASLDPDARELVGMVGEAHARMGEVIRGVLALSRIHPELTRREPVDLTQVVDEIEQALHEVPDGTAIERGSLPVVHADRGQMQQLLSNLVSNAVKFRGSRPPRISVDAERGDGAWTISVADGGIGIPPEYLNRIFEPLQRLHARDDYPGTGLGLTICRKIVEGHGGRIWAESDGRTGSRFRFTIPDMRD